MSKLIGIAMVAVSAVRPIIGRATKMHHFEMEKVLIYVLVFRGANYLRANNANRWPAGLG